MGLGLHEVHRYTITKHPGKDLGISGVLGLKSWVNDSLVHL
jgi:hypothetical protein